MRTVLRFGLIVTLLATVLSGVPAVAAFCPAAGQNPCWTTVAPISTARHSLAVATDSAGRIYTVAGGNIGQEFVLEAYDPGSNSWTAKAPPPVARVTAGFAFSSATNRFYLFGGWNEGYFDDVYEYDPVADVWSAKAPLPTHRWLFAAAAGPSGKIYLFGGGAEDGVCLSTVEEYDPSTDTWRSRAAMPTPRCALAAVTAPNGSIYTIGGELGALGGYQQDATVEAYDPTSDTWTTKASMSIPRWNFGASMNVQGNIYAVGGQDITGIFHNTDAVEEYDILTDSWTMRTPLPVATGLLGLALGADGRVYAIGGQAADGSIVNTVYAGFVPDTTRRLTALGPAQVWVGLRNSDDIGVRFDLQVEAYRDGVPVATGRLDSVPAGSSGFPHARLHTIPFDTFTSPIAFPAGSRLELKVMVRNACVGSGHNSGIARLWFDDAAANSRFGATVDLPHTYYLRNSSALSTTVGPGPKRTIDVQSGAKCSPFKPFGTWTITP